MQKISSSTATANGAGEFTQGQPGSGIDATMITVAWLNAIQRELVNLVQGSGQELKPEDDKQVLTAVKALQELASTWDKIAGKPTSRDGYKLSDVFTKTEVGIAIQNAVSGLMPKAGGAFSPKFMGLSFNSEVTGYNELGSYVGWGSAGTGTAQFICNKGSGSTGGFVWGTVGADNQTLGPLMSYSANGILSVPNALSVPAITSNTTVSTQAPGYVGGFIANCAYVSTAISGKLNGNTCSEAGFAGGNAALPYMKHANGTVVSLQVDRPKDTALLSTNGWSKNPDTGEIKQWQEIAFDDLSSIKAINVTWQFQFPNQFINAQITLKKTTTAAACVQAYYLSPTKDGCIIHIEEWAGIVQGGLVAIIEARGN